MNLNQQAVQYVARVQLRRGIKAVEKGKLRISRPRESGNIVPTYAQYTVNKLQPNDDGDRAFIRDVGTNVAKIVVNSAELT